MMWRNWFHVTVYVAVISLVAAACERCPKKKNIQMKKHPFMRTGMYCWCPGWFLHVVHTVFVCCWI